ncbi:MAG: hypothetical protein E7568_06370 [Ruminococcaceae bacterium]|nr:hypothetical protein [Oscillospiraceae bacterium]
MNIREINYSVYINDILPKTVQRAGVQNEHNATVLNFRLMDELINKLKAIPAGRKLYYRFDVYDSGGGYHPTVPKELGLKNNILTYEIGQAVTAAGGTFTAYLVICMILADETELIVYVKPALLELENVPDGTASEEREIVNVSTPVAAAENYAKQSLENAKKAKEEYQNAKKLVEEFNLKLLSGKRNFIGITKTNVSDNSTSEYVVLIDGTEHYAEYGDVVLTEAAFKYDLDNDGHTDEYDSELLNLYLAGSIPLNKDYDYSIGDRAILKLLLAGAYGSCYYWWNGKEWKPYSMISDRVYNPKSLNPQSGIAVDEAIKAAINEESYKNAIADIVLNNMPNGDEVSY